ncbi:glycoside hydrolase family 3 N-terminal domain-containing protein [Flavobacterium psychrotrophum]|uniref:glycoside hydrolase family 3 N-terminal domain-containing protein n=1 Tax=Flavobacterium psychrotrophum TaxID=2294119 RepID=UPI000E30F148|nr:glycoside hydrolase family 3 N-terminal domain-containing protein [Flavobacterium psychrotrophum]
MTKMSSLKSRGLFAVGFLAILYSLNAQHVFFKNIWPGKIDCNAGQGDAPLQNTVLQVQVNDTTERFIISDKIKFRDFNKNGKLDAYEDFRKPVSKRAKDLLSKMTLEEKIAQLQCTFNKKTKIFPNNTFDQDQAKLRYANGLGGILRASDGGSIDTPDKDPKPKELAMLTNQTQRFFINQTRLGIPVVFVEEGLHGMMMRNGTLFPSSLGMSSSWDEDLTSEVFATIAAEARAVGAHTVLGPVIDLGLDPRWGRTEETMGEDPYLTARMGVVKVKALQGNAALPDSSHVASVLKHFGAHGDGEGGGNTSPIIISERQLREVNFKPFAAAIKEGHAMGIMPNYNEINGIPAHADPWLLTVVLRKEMGFKGLVISDYNATQEIFDMHHIAADTLEAAVKAIRAGVDMELTDNVTYRQLPKAIKQGKIAIAEVDKAVQQVLELKFSLGIFEHPYIDFSTSDIVGSDKHRETALKAARESMVLLKNENNVLPFNRKKYKKIAIIGPNADQCILGGYSKAPVVQVTPLQAIKEKYGNDVEIVYALGCRLGVQKSKSIYAAVKLPTNEENAKLTAEAVEVAKGADAIVLMLGGNDKISREAVATGIGGDLTNLDLLGGQNNLINALKALNKPTAAFVFSGPPIAFENLDESVPAIVQCWYLGQETGYAVAETLFGDNNPSGKLTITIPRSAGHLPVYYYQKPSSRVRGYNLSNPKPLYPFGHGLSYTTFEYTKPKLSANSIKRGENVTVSFDVKNTGDRNGDEIVQLYIRDEVSSVTRPLKELKDYTRISLSPGEIKTVTFTISPDKLSFFTSDFKEIVEPGDFTIMAGQSSEKHQTVRLTVK